MKNKLKDLNDCKDLLKDTFGSADPREIKNKLKDLNDCKQLLEDTFGTSDPREIKNKLNDLKESKELLERNLKDKMKKLDEANARNKEL